MSFQIQLSPEDVEFYRAISNQREREAAAWKRVLDSVEEYVRDFVAVFDTGSVEYMQAALEDALDDAVANVRGEKVGRMRDQIVEGSRVRDGLPTE